MIARTAYVQLHFSPALLVLTVVAMLVVWVAPIMLALFAQGAAQWIGAGVWLAATLSFLPTLRRFRLSALWALGLPLIAGFYTAATLGSALNHHRGRGVVWKNRAYTEAIPNSGRISNPAPDQKMQAPGR